MASYDYISGTDITDKVVLGVINRDATYKTAMLTYANDAVEDLAQTNGVMIPSQIKTPVHTVIKQWAIATLGARVCLDSTEVADIEAGQIDKYGSKYAMYMSILSKLKNQITSEMITGNITSAGSRVTTGILYVG